VISKPVNVLMDLQFVILLLFIRVIKSRRLRWAGHVARMGERRGTYRALVGKPEGTTWKTQA
jgi:hypothetical protein